MNRYLLITLLFFIGISPSFASVAAPTGAVFTDDGTHWSMINRTNNMDTLVIDGITQATYQKIDAPSISRNKFYTIGTDSAGMNYLLVDGKVVDMGEQAGFVYNSTNYQIIDAWYTINQGKYRLTKSDGTIILENTNAGSSSYIRSLGNDLIQSVLYNRNNTIATTYINERKVGPILSLIGTYKKGKKKELFFLSTSSDELTATIIAYDPTNGKIRDLPSYDGVGTYAVITDTSGNITDMNYSVAIDDTFAIADIRGDLLSSARYDSITNLTNYGDKIFRSYVLDGKSYFFFDGKTYGGFDEIDALNVTYKSPNYTKVKKWSIFVKKDGKDFIIANGKQFAL